LLDEINHKPIKYLLCNNNFYQLLNKCDSHSCGIIFTLPNNFALKKEFSKTEKVLEKSMLQIKFETCQKWKRGKKNIFFYLFVSHSIWFSHPNHYQTWFKIRFHFWGQLHEHSYI